MKSSISFMLLLFTRWLITASSLYGQEWSKRQETVWETVETYWELSAAGNLDQFMDHYHKNYTGWVGQNPMPSDKAMIQKFAGYFFETTKTIVYDINPVAIQVHDEVAVVHYYFTEVVQDQNGQEVSRSGRWTDVLVQQDNDWLLFSDHGGTFSAQ